MRFRSLLACGLLGASLGTTPAMARFGFCMAQIPGKTTQIPGHYNSTYPSYISGILDFGADPETSEKTVGNQFAASVGRTGGAVCYTHLEDADAAQYWRSESLKKGLGQHIDTGWTGGNAAAANGRVNPKPVSPGGAFISIRDNGEAVRLKAWDDSVMQLKREDAARKVRAAIATAESKAKYERIMKAAAERMRKLGGKQ